MNRIPRTAIGLLVGALFASASCAERAHAADALVKVESVRPGLGEGTANGVVKTANWAPVTVDLQAARSPVEGVLEIIAPDDTGTPTTFRRQVALKAGEFQRVPVYLRTGARARADIAARVVDARGRPISDVWSNGIDLLDPFETVVVTVGKPEGVEQVRSLAKYANADATGSALLEVVRQAADGLPGRWFGYDAADVVVLDTNDANVMSRLDAGRALALKDWVGRGGHLVIAVGANWQAVRGGVLDELLPAVPVGTVRLNDASGLEAFAGGNKPLETPITVAKLENLEKRGGVALAIAGSNPLVVRGPFRFGRVTLVALDTDLRPFATWEDRKNFWDKVLDLRGRSGSAVLNQAAVLRNRGGAFFQQSSNDLASILHESLERFPGVKLIPFGWVAFFVFLYILLIGPGDYFFLKKVVKRMELTWITFPLIVVGVSLLAYLAAYSFKGTDMRLNKVDLVDVDQTTNQSRGATWVTLFSPQNRDYTIQVLPVSLDSAPVTGVVSAPDAQPPAGSEVLLSWFGNPDRRFQGGLSLAASGYDYGPLGQAEVLSNVRVPIWSTKSFEGRWTAPAGRLIEADLSQGASDRIEGTLTNTTRFTLRRPILVYGRNYFELGAGGKDKSLAPGASATINPTEFKSLSGYVERSTQGLSQRSVAYNGPETVVNGMDVSRADVIRAAMFHDALGARGESFPNLPLHDLDLSGQALELKRPMLVAEIDGPAAQIRMGATSSPPIVAQTTLLRIILPIKVDESK